MNKRYIRYIKKGIKILASAIIALLIVLLIGALIFQLPKVKNYIANRVVQKVEEKNGAHLAIDKIAVFFMEVFIYKVYMLRIMKRIHSCLLKA